MNNNALSRKTTAPAFAIVDEEVSNSPIYMSVDVVSQDLRDGGYILLEYGTYIGQDYLSLLDETMIHLRGFTADVCFEGSSYLLLDNLALNADQELQIQIDAGAYVSKENGSRSQAVQLEPNNPAEDQAIPTACIMKLGQDSRCVKAGGDLILLIFGSDETTCFLNKMTDIVETDGFTYDDCQISVMGLNIRVAYTNVRPLDREKCSVTLKEGVFKDLAGNESKVVTFPFTIITP